MFPVTSDSSSFGGMACRKPISPGKSLRIVTMIIHGFVSKTRPGNAFNGASRAVCHLQTETFILTYEIAAISVAQILSDNRKKLYNDSCLL